MGQEQYILGFRTMYISANSVWIRNSKWIWILNFILLNKTQQKAFANGKLRSIMRVWFRSYVYGPMLEFLVIRASNQQTNSVRCNLLFLCRLDSLYISLSAVIRDKFINDFLILLRRFINTTNRNFDYTISIQPVTCKIWMQHDIHWLRGLS